MPREHSLPMGRNTTIALRVFEPSEPPLAVVVIPSAMGVSQHYYARFADWLATQGYAAITFDYRGIGLSAPRSLRGYRMNILDWAKDCAAVIEYAKGRWPRCSLAWLGHSLGGQLLGLIANASRIDRVMTIATGNGYWLENSWPTRRIVWWMWFVAVPLATWVAGYFSGRRLRMVGDLPRGVIEQWRRWCLNPEYVVGVEGDDVRAAYAAVQLPIRSLSFTDDEMMSARSIRSLHALYSNAPIDYVRIAPGDIGAQRIGHFGFFRPQFEKALWPLVPQWLNTASQQTGQPAR